jgi:dTDP-4-amino-4,6-dideoxygalactose transaminase
MHATKPVTAAEGAFAIARDTDLIERLRRRSNFGFDSGRSAQRIGLNAKMSEYHAAVGLASLDSWPVRRARLMAVAGQYRESLAELPEASLQEGWGERWIGTTLSIRLTGCGDAAALCDRLACAGVEARQWWRGCHRDPAFAAFDRMPLPGTESLARTTLALPFFEDLTPADIESIVQRLKDLLSRGR